MKCPKCNGDMKLGISPSFAGAGLTVWQTVDNASSLLSSLKPYVPIQIYRCSKCGYLESYAVEDSK